MSQHSDLAIGLAVELDGQLDPVIRDQVIHGGLTGLSKDETWRIIDMLLDVKQGKAVWRKSATQPKYQPRKALQCQL